MGDKKKPKTWRDVCKTSKGKTKNRLVVETDMRIPHHPKNCPNVGWGINHHGGCEYCDTKIPVNKSTYKIK